MRTLTRDTLVDLVEESCGIPRPAADRQVDAALGLFLAALPPHAAAHLARHIEGGASILAALPRAHDVPASLTEAVERFAASTTSDKGPASEVLGVVAGALADAWTEDDRRVVLADLPPDLRALFADREPAEGLRRHPPRAEPELDERRTLSTGRPGSRHPLATSAAEDRDASGRPNPHGESKLSSGGPALERGRHTLATGKPSGSTR
jgi:hypothetical protein